MFFDKKKKTIFKDKSGSSNSTVCHVTKTRLFVRIQINTFYIVVFFLCSNLLEPINKFRVFVYAVIPTYTILGASI